jgi:hypothetical protein
MVMPDADQYPDAEQRDHLADLWARAHHEAAHAVVAILLGAQVSQIEIWPGPPAGGRTQMTGLDEPDPGPAGYGLVRRLAYLIAGPIAERVAGGGSGAILNEPASVAARTLLEGVRDPSTVDADTDLGRAAALIGAYFGPDDEAGFAAAVDHLPLSVEAVVRGQWDAIQVVAVNLLRRGRLTDEQLHSLWSAVLPAAPPSDLLELLPPG